MEKIQNISGSESEDIEFEENEEEFFNNEEISDEDLDENLDIDSGINYNIDEQSWIKGEIYKLDSPFCNYKNPKLNEIIQTNLSDYLFHQIEKRILLLQIFFRQIIDNKLLLKIAKWTNQHHQQQLKSEKGDALNNSHIIK